MATLEQTKKYGLEERTEALLDVSRTRLNAAIPHQVRVEATRSCASSSPRAFCTGWSTCTARAGPRATTAQRTTEARDCVQQVAASLLLTRCARPGDPVFVCAGAAEGARQLGGNPSQRGGEADNAQVSVCYGSGGGARRCAVLRGVGCAVAPACVRAAGPGGPQDWWPFTPAAAPSRRPSDANISTRVPDDRAPRPSTGRSRKGGRTCCGPTTTWACLS